MRTSCKINALSLETVVFKMESSCLHGSWEDGICKCESGYVSEFRDTELNPIYCGKRDDVLVINLRKGYEPIDLLHYGTMSLTVGLAVESLLVLIFFLYTLCDAWRLSGKIQKAQERLKNFESDQVKRSSTENLNAKHWYPDMNVYKCVNDPDFTIEKATKEKEKKKVLYAKVLHDYKPRETGELRLHVGDVITDVVRLNQGWCKGELYGKFGFYPEVYAEIFEPDLKSEKLIGSSDEKSSSKVVASKGRTSLILEESKDEAHTSLHPKLVRKGTSSSNKTKKQYPATDEETVNAVTTSKINLLIEGPSDEGVRKETTDKVRVGKNTSLIDFEESDSIKNTSDQRIDNLSGFDADNEQIDARKSRKKKKLLSKIRGDDSSGRRSLVRKTHSRKGSDKQGHDRKIEIKTSYLDLSGGDATLKSDDRDLERISDKKIKKHSRKKSSDLEWGNSMGYESRTTGKADLKLDLDRPARDHKSTSKKLKKYRTAKKKEEIALDLESDASETGTKKVIAPALKLDNTTLDRKTRMKKKKMVQFSFESADDMGHAKISESSGLEWDGTKHSYGTGHARTSGSSGLEWDGADLNRKSRKKREKLTLGHGHTSDLEWDDNRSKTSRKKVNDKEEIAQSGDAGTKKTMTSSLEWDNTAMDHKISKKLSSDFTSDGTPSKKEEIALDLEPDDALGHIGDLEWDYTAMKRKSRDKDYMDCKSSKKVVKEDTIEKTIQRGPYLVKQSSMKAAYEDTTKQRDYVDHKSSTLSKKVVVKEDTTKNTPSTSTQRYTMKHKSGKKATKEMIKQSSEEAAKEMGQSSKKAAKEMKQSSKKAAKEMKQRSKKAAKEMSMKAAKGKDSISSTGSKMVKEGITSSTLTRSDTIQSSKKAADEDTVKQEDSMGHKGSIGIKKETTTRQDIVGHIMTERPAATSALESHEVGDTKQKGSKKPKLSTTSTLKQFVMGRRKTGTKTTEPGTR